MGMPRTLGASLVMFLLGFAFLIIIFGVMYNISGILFGIQIDKDWALISATVLATGSILAGALLQEER